MPEILAFQRCIARYDAVNTFAAISANTRYASFRDFLYFSIGKKIYVSHWMSKLA